MDLAQLVGHEVHGSRHRLEEEGLHKVPVVVHDEYDHQPNQLLRLHLACLVLVVLKRIHHLLSVRGRPGPGHSVSRMPTARM